MEILQRVGGEEGVLVAADARAADSDIGSEAVEIDGGFDGALGVVGKLSEEAGDHAREEIAAPSFGHARVAGGVDTAIEPSGWAIKVLEPLRTRMSLFLTAKSRAILMRSAWTCLIGEAGETGHFAGVRSEDEGAALGDAGKAAGVGGNGVEGVGVGNGREAAGFWSCIQVGRERIRRPRGWYPGRGRRRGR